MPRKNARVRLPVLVLATLSSTVIAADLSPAEVLQGQQETLKLILAGNPSESVASIRRRCASGTELDAINKSRAIGWQSMPDGADYCAAALDRTARDGKLLSFYRETLQSAAGASPDYDKLPAAIGASVMRSHSDQVAVGAGRAMVVTPALAWDAGFSVAYQQRQALPSRVPDIHALKPIAGRCLGEQEHDLSLCYSTGYAYGLRAAHGLPVTAPE